MKALFNISSLNTKNIMILVFGYIIVQFIWWEILLVRQNNTILEQKQQLVELTINDHSVLKTQVEEIHQIKKRKTWMVVGEGTIFLLLLLFGIQRIQNTYKREQELLKQKSNFLLSITHELKTPLAATKLKLQTLQKHKLDDDKREMILSEALSENERLTALVNNVLMATKFQQQKQEVHLESVELKTFIESIIKSNFKELLDAGIIKLELTSNLRILADRILFPSLIINLIENAIKYSEEVPRIELQLFEESESVIVKISDCGIGISNSELENIYEPFYRAGIEETRKTKGTGLGLFIVKSVMNLHNGRIGYSKNVPKGSAFSLIFNKQ
ncbi:MAG: sensor histidine kinase [Bacteroidia bacterium]